MKRAGRPSAESKAALTLIDVSQFRPDPPKHLTPEQQKTRSEIVGSMKPGSFPPSTYVLLELYCMHASRCHFIAAQIAKLDIKKSFKEFRLWAGMQRAETAILCSLATKLRLLVKTNTRAERQQATETGAPWNIRRRPWEDDDDEPTPAA